MCDRWMLFAGTALFLAITALGDRPLAAAEPASKSAADSFPEMIRPLLETHCLGCHGDVDPQGGLSLSVFQNDDDVLRAPEIWQRVWEAIHRQEMPPEAPLPTSDEREKLSSTIADLLSRGDREGRRNTGQVVLRRLNQIEYNNTVLDLFAVHRSTSYYNPQQGLPDEIRIIPFRDYRRTVVPLPPDDVGYGFTNIGEVLSLPPFLMEKYLAAARQMVDLLADDQQSRRNRGQAEEAENALRDRTGDFMRRLARSLHATSDDPHEAARTFVAALGRRAFRRPLSGDEIDRYLSLYQAAAQRGEPFEEALQAPAQAMLASPHFLFRVEHGVEDQQQKGLRPLSDHELATRLSYFLWSSMPDEELLRLADAGQLRDPDVLEAQARRMLRHRFSKALPEQFGLQWLGLSGIRSAMPFPDLYPQFYKLKYLPESFQIEVSLLFETILIEDRSVLDFLDPGFSWLNGTLNGFYAIEPERDNPHTNSHLQWQRYEISDKRRGGILAMGGTMLATSLATRTSPVLRGQWVLETILGTPPPPPPPNVDNILDSPVAEDQHSFRERLARHRADPACASCHRRMDPIGFGLENYDAIGAWRQSDGAEPIDTVGELLDGTRFDGPVELKEILVTERRDDFLRCLSEKMMTYALGRRLGYFDAPAIAQIREQLHRDDYRFSTLVVGIVRSEPFRYLNAPVTAD